MQPETAGSKEYEKDSQDEVLRQNMLKCHKGRSFAGQMSIMQDCCSRADELMKW